VDGIYNFGQALLRDSFIKVRLSHDPPSGTDFTSQIE
jgi:hypothetical protein